MEIISLARLHMLPVSSLHGAGSFINKDCCKVLMLPGPLLFRKGTKPSQGESIDY